jgi:RimJ/RimL family protein N-acetyltransferase
LWSEKKNQEWQEKNDENPGRGKFFFQVRRLEDDRLLGFVELGELDWTNSEAWVGIGLGERDAWGRGYGTDAMRLMLRYAFTELNLHRVSLNVFSYNPRAIRSYEKAGFRVEGCIRQAMQREGRRWDYVYMGLLRSEWEALQEEK